MRIARLGQTGKSHQVLILSLIQGGFLAVQEYVHGRKAPDGIEVAIGEEITRASDFKIVLPVVSSQRFGDVNAGIILNEGLEDSFSAAYLKAG
jgi:hypothetical protein